MRSFIYLCALVALTINPACGTYVGNGSRHPADFNQDGFIDNRDSSHIVVCKGISAETSSVCGDADLDKSGYIDELDEEIFLKAMDRFLEPLNKYDVNEDGALDLLDFSMIRQCVRGVELFQIQHCDNCDLNGDNACDNSDVDYFVDNSNLVVPASYTVFGDFTGDDKVDLIDFDAWYGCFISFVSDFPFCQIADIAGSHLPGEEPSKIPNGSIGVPDFTVWLDEFRFHNPDFFGNN